MAELLRVPAVAAGATEVVFAEWLVAIGDTFEVGDPLALVETDKAVVEIEAETGATLLKALADGGTRVQVGSPLALIGSTADLDADADSLLAALGVRGGAASDVAVPREAGSRDARNEEAREPVDRPLASPIARRLLRDAGVAMADVKGSGPGGRIVRRDVEGVLAARQAAVTRPVAAPQATTSVGGSTYEIVPHSRGRRAIATRLTASMREVPHFYLRRTAVVDELLALRATLNEHAPARLSVNDFLLRAVAVAHTRVPEMNVVWTEEGMRRFDSVDIGVAISSELGLVSPVLRAVEQQSLSAISAAVLGFVRQADEGRLRQHDLEGGSISVTNLGMHGVEEFAAIINPPQSAILAVGAARPAVRIVDGVPAPVTVVNLVLSVDHRAIDGTPAARWMEALVGALERPLRLLV